MAKTESLHPMVWAAPAAWLGLRVGAGLVRALDPRYSLRGRVALITGGSRGLGLELARELACQGARVAVCSRDPAELERARADLAGRGYPLWAFVCDLNDGSNIERLFQNVQAELGSIDVLINNAGIIQVGPMEEMTLEDYERAMATHFWAPLRAILLAVPEMRKRGGGRIVNVSSIGGLVAVPHLLPYGASKFALTGLSEGLRAELARYGIRVTTVCPGLLRTGSPRNAEFKGKHRQEYAWFALGATPLSSMNSRRAARRIVRALRTGEAHVVLTWQAKLLALAHAVSPGLVARMFGVVDRLLPSPGGIGQQSARGSESQSRLAPSVLTALSDRAAQRNNEVS
jgi:NAD(P)-dependent dehydrogenase (short-subunit alcohol dehydrogenase family)